MQDQIPVYKHANKKTISIDEQKSLQEQGQKNDVEETQGERLVAHELQHFWYEVGQQVLEERDP